MIRIVSKLILDFEQIKKRRRKLLPL
jgi:hypothetical protein